MKRFPKLAEYLRSQGVDVNKVTDYRFMNSDRTGGLRAISRITAIMQSFVKQYSAQPEAPGAAPQPMSTRPIDVSQRPGCNLDKPNPTKHDIINCLQATYGRSKAGQRVNMYQYMRDYGMSENDMVVLIVNLFGGSRPRTWFTESIIRAVDSRYGL